MLTAEDKKLIEDERFDPNRIILGCEAHKYFGPSEVTKAFPAEGCKRCWMVFIIHDLASVAPSERAQRFSEFEEVVRNLNQAVEHGKWDFVAFRHPEIKYDSKG